MSIVNEVCNDSSGASAPKNTGGKKQCIEGAVRSYILTKEDFTFDDLAAAKLKTNWDTASTSKDIAVFWDIEEINNNNTEATILEKRYSNRKTKDGVKGVDYTHNLSVCSHEVLESYEDSDFTRVFRFTDKNEVLCEIDDDGKVKGQPLSSLLVAEREDPTPDADPISVISFKFKKHSVSIFKPSFDLDVYQGIFDVVIEQVSASSTELKLKFRTACANSYITSLEDGDVIVKNDEGVAQSVTFVAADSNKEVTITGTGFATGFTVELNGVVSSGGNLYEEVEPLTLEVS